MKTTPHPAFSPEGEKEPKVNSNCGKIVYVVTEDWYFCSHRLPIARRARDAGFEVLVATRVNQHTDVLQAEGFRVIPLKLRRRGSSPWRELAALLEIFTLYRKERPVIVHHVALKPVIYGSIAARFARVPVVVNALAGLGFIFTSSGMRASLLRPVVRLALRVLLSAKGTHTIVQNSDDQHILRTLKVPSQHISVIQGSGVDVDRLRPQPEPDHGVVATLVSRMLWDKGVGELVQCARELAQREVPVKFRLVGIPDSSNPASIDERQLVAWDEEGIIEWMGYQADISAVWAHSHIAVLPSYREGLPKSLLEAAACARPIVTTDVPGCRVLVEHGVNGLLVPAKDASALADAIATLAEDADLRRRMGKRGRERVEQRFSDTLVSAQTLSLYRSALQVQ